MMTILPPRTEINEKLLCRLRVTFLDVVRSAYWKQIEEGTLPRNSLVAVTLLYSVDVGIEFAHIPGHQDWSALEPTLKKRSYDWVKRVFYPVDGMIWGFLKAWSFLTRQPMIQLTPVAVAVVDMLEWYQDAYAVSLLTNFIAAHRYAQIKAPQYLGETEVSYYSSCNNV